ncbi:MAG: type II toxin-antitoxin system VapC family toxin [Nitrososphaerales archaeon]
MKRVYLDTSAFVKLFFDEMDSDLVESIAELARSKKIQIAMSEWNVNEAIWTVEKKVLRGKISNKEAFRVINLMADIISVGINDGTVVWLGFPSEAVVNSRVVIEELHVNAADALHIYFARTSDCSHLISADEDLVLRLRFGGLRIEAVYLHSSVDMNKFLMDVS